ncbi:MAG: 5-formyltetrahydrofolate cyclo-ligase [Planctomycetota bacterium]
MSGTGKAALRRRLRGKRRDLTDAVRRAEGGRLHRRLDALPEYTSARTVFVYVAAGSEVPTAPLIDDLLGRGVTVAVPQVDDADAGRMSAVRINGPPLETTPDLTILPGLGFDPETGVRLGQGGGFYDRYLAAYPGTFAVGLAFDVQLQTGLPAETHDRPVDAIVTPTRTQRFDGRDRRGL